MNTNIPCWWIIFYVPPTPKIPRLIIWAKIIWLPLTSTDLHLTYLTNCDCTSFRLNLMLHLCTSNGFHSIEKEQTKNALVYRLYIVDILIVIWNVKCHAKNYFYYHLRFNNRQFLVSNIIRGLNHQEEWKAKLRRHFFWFFEIY